MLFDKLCKIAESKDGSFFDSLPGVLSRAALIHYTPEARDLAAKSTSADLEGSLNSFFMPFSVCAVEASAADIPDGTPHVALFEAGCNVIKEPPGFSLSREGVYLTILMAFPARGSDEGYLLMEGAVGGGWHEGQPSLALALARTSVYSRKLRLMAWAAGPEWVNNHGEKIDIEGPSSVARQAAGISMSFVSYFNDPDNIVISQQSSGRALWNPNTRIRRSDARPRYMAVPRKKAMRVLGVSEAQERELRSLMRGHPRRAHWRELRADRYVNKQGQRIRVRETWIGPEEATIRGVRYKVHLGTPDELSQQNGVHR